jgi:hypothetical protein
MYVTIHRWASTSLSLHKASRPGYPVSCAATCQPLGTISYEGSFIWPEVSGRVTRQAFEDLFHHCCTGEHAYSHKPFYMPMTLYMRVVLQQLDGCPSPALALLDLAVHVLPRLGGTGLLVKLAVLFVMCHCLSVIQNNVSVNLICFIFNQCVFGFQFYDGYMNMTCSGRWAFSGLRNLYSIISSSEQAFQHSSLHMCDICCSFSIWVPLLFFASSKQ